MPYRENDDVFDVYIIGGGINGVGIARDAIGRGLKTGMCEQGDLAGETSSASSKLIHGGLRYLEQYEFRLVRESLSERETLLKIAPHIAFPLRFCLPNQGQLRANWMVRIGLFLYDHLAFRSQLSKSAKIKFNRRDGLVPAIKTGFEYSDVWMDDARLVVLNALDFHRRGGDISTQTKAIKALRKKGVWQVTLLDQVTGAHRQIKARSLVNAAGPWVESLFGETVEECAPRKIRLVKGSHIVVNKVSCDDRAYILQNEDGRVVFVIPYLGQFSMIGTTDVEYLGDPAEAACSLSEKNYLCAVVNQYFTKSISLSDIVWDFSGVRPLCNDGTGSPQTVTRDYTIELQDGEGEAPIVSVFGGKLTTYRKLAESVVNKLSAYFDTCGSCWTARSVLPGGVGYQSAHQCERQLASSYPWLDESTVRRLSRSYGVLSWELLEGKDSIEALGEHFGFDLYSSEVDYLILNEWAYFAEDILWRRTKLGLFISDHNKEKLQQYVEKRRVELLPERFPFKPIT